MTITPEEELDFAKELLRAFKKTTPSAPDWYGMIDQCVNVLMHRYVAQLEREAAPLSDPGYG